MSGTGIAWVTKFVESGSISGKNIFINEEYSGDQLTTINLLDPQTCTVQELEAFDPKLLSFTFSDDGKRLLIHKQEYGVAYEYYIVNLIERYQDKL